MARIIGSKWVPKNVAFLISDHVNALCTDLKVAKIELENVFDDQTLHVRVTGTSMAGKSMKRNWVLAPNFWVQHPVYSQLGPIFDDDYDADPNVGGEVC